MIKLLAKRPFTDEGGRVKTGDVIFRSNEIAADYVQRKLCKYMTSDWQPTERATKTDSPETSSEDAELVSLNIPKRRGRAKK